MDPHLEEDRTQGADQFQEDDRTQQVDPHLEEDRIQDVDHPQEDDRTLDVEFPHQAGPAGTRTWPSPSPGPVAAPSEPRTWTRFPG